MNTIRSIATGLLVMAAAAPVQANDLWTVYQHALDNDPLIREAEASRNAQREQRPQARAGLLPALNFAGSRADSSADGTQIALLPDDTIGLVDFSSDTDETTLTLRLDQPIFRWDRWVALRQANASVARAEINYEAARQDLIVRVAERYFDLLAAQDNLAFAGANKEAIERQLDQARRRFEVGLIAITDVQEAQAGFDTAVADEIAARRRVASAREALREITGEYYRELAGPKAELPLVVPEPRDEDAWVERAIADNLALNAQRLTTEISRDEVRRQRAGHLPTVDFEAVRGSRDRSGTNPFDTSDTDFRALTLRVNVPLFAGGATSSRSRQAAHEHEAAKQALEREARFAERIARDAYLGLESDISRVQALRQASQSNETALQAVEAGFEVGTRTAVDVLNARSAAFRARNDLAQSRYEYLQNILRLKQAAGTLTEADLRHIDTLLQ